MSVLKSFGSAALGVIGLASLSILGVWYSSSLPICTVDLEGKTVEIYSDGLRVCEADGCADKISVPPDMQWMQDMVIDLRCHNADPSKYFEDAPNPPDQGV